MGEPTKIPRAVEYVLGAIFLALVLYLTAQVACSGPRGPSPEEVRARRVAACRADNLRRIRSCDGPCAKLKGQRYDECVKKCSASKGRPIMDCDAIR